jgi:hypothetical protein
MGKNKDKKVKNDGKKKEKVLQNLKPVDYDGKKKYNIFKDTGGCMSGLE